ncbi:MAG TPA: HAMP domain-containing sensor histidine kinase [Gemmatimonadaceae bacterium]|nr:HAMP domain-containing sensor histidine kinase [Gemmatimonadaceae bacterium]
MPSIRARITTSYALALAGTIVVSTIVLVIERRDAATKDLIERANAIADLAARIVGQAGASDEQQRIFADTTAGSRTTFVDKQFNPRFVALLDVLPEYVVITDESRVFYASVAARLLKPKDYDALTTEALRSVRLTPKAKVNLTGDLVLLSDPHEVRRETGLRRVVAGVSMKPVDVATNEVLQVVVVAVPLILLVSVAAAWGIGGRFAFLELMVNDVEAITDGRSLHRRIPVDYSDDEVGRLGLTLNAMLSRLEGSFAALRRFTADASHEFKAPLTVLRADIERAMSLPQGGTEQLVALEEALAETTRMSSLVESLLTLARADEGRFDLHREPVDVQALVHDVAETANILGEVHHLTVIVTRIDAATVLGDPVRLRQLFLNLVENAVKYSPKGGAVELALEARDDAAVFSVKDHGIGIAGTDLPFIFERFWRVDRARSRGERAGAGLGLAICQWIAQAHGGSISVSSRLGRGSTFAVTIPAVRAAPGGPTPCPPPQVAAAGAATEA